MVSKTYSSTAVISLSLMLIIASTISFTVTVKNSSNVLTDYLLEFRINGQRLAPDFPDRAGKVPVTGKDRQEISARNFKAHRFGLIGYFYGYYVQHSDLPEVVIEGKKYGPIKSTFVPEVCSPRKNYDVVRMLDEFPGASEDYSGIKKENSLGFWSFSAGAFLGVFQDLYCPLFLSAGERESVR